MGDNRPTPPASSPPAAPPPLRLETTSDTAAVAGARRAVEAFAAAGGFGDEAAGQLGLVVNEALANVIRHAYGGQAGRPVVVTAEMIDGRASASGTGTSTGDSRPAGPAVCDGPHLRITIRDWGSGVDPSALMSRPKDPATPGGIGLFCLREMMDSVAYARQPDGGMLLTMTKRKC